MTPLKRLTRAFNVRAAAVGFSKRFGKTVGGYGEYPGGGPPDMMNSMMSGTMLGNVCDNTKFNFEHRRGEFIISTFNLTPYCDFPKMLVILYCLPIIGFIPSP